MSKSWWPILRVAGLWCAVVILCEHTERRWAYRKARDAAGDKPLLVVGCPSNTGNHPCGDVCLDVDPAQLTLCQSQRPTLGDVRSIPFPDGYFGACLCSHVLEHLDSIDDVQQAISELQRVTDGPFYILSPSDVQVFAHLNPEHHLLVVPTDNRLLVETLD